MKCASSMTSVSWVWRFAGCAICGSALGIVRIAHILIFGKSLRHRAGRPVWSVLLTYSKRDGRRFSTAFRTKRPALLRRRRLRKKSSPSRSVSTLRFVLGVSETEGDMSWPTSPSSWSICLKVKPGKQEALIALLKENIDTVIRTLDGWKATRLIAAKDGAGVAIYSEWESPAAVEAMRGDPRMKAYFPKISALASLDSMMGSAVLSEAHPSVIAPSSCVTQARKGEPQDGSDGRDLPDAERTSRRSTGITSTSTCLSPRSCRAQEIRGQRRPHRGAGRKPPNVHRIGTLYFDDLAAIEKAFASPEGLAAGADRRTLCA